MNTDQHNELIDRYLRDELYGPELETFLQMLESDAELKKDVQLRMLIVKGIQEQGAIQLKAYLREKTSQKRTLLISFKTWYYAAAAIFLVLITSGVVFYSLRQNIKESNTMAAKADKDYHISAKPVDSNFIAAKPEKQNITANDHTGPQNSGNSIASGEASIAKEDGFGSKSEPMPPLVNAAPAEMLIASNIPIIPIRIESPIETATAMSARSIKEKTPISGGSKGKDTFARTDDAPSSESIAKYEDTRFILDFYNSEDAVPRVKTDKNNKNNTLLMVYNLPYDNPLIFTYQNKCYLRTGSKFYEINPNESTSQKVVAVTDQALLKKLNQ